MMRQYQSVKRSLPADVILFFRLGDFYEMFLEDAKQAAGILNVALTKRGDIPMCGVPFHAAPGYIAKIIQAGRRVAICEQVGEVRPGKIVQREVTQIVSAGTINDLNLLDAQRHNYLAAACRGKKKFGLAFLDITTGDFRITELDTLQALQDELGRVAPAEIVAPEAQQTELQLPHATVTDDYAFLPEQAAFVLMEHFEVKTLEGFGCEHLDSAVGAGGAILHYLKTVMRRDPANVRTLRVYNPQGFMVLDSTTRENLEIVESRSREGQSLFQAVNRTVTPMGARLLRDWLVHPLLERAPIEHRQDAISLLLDDPMTLAILRETLGNIRDIERIVGRLGQGAGNARDLQALASSLEALPEISRLVTSVTENATASASTLFHPWLQQTHDFRELTTQLTRAIVDEPPIPIKEGGMFRDGYREELDELRNASREGKHWIAALQQRESERTGIKSLKIRFNSVFGYFIEITKANLANVPDDYHRKQTTVNAERFITPELKEMESKILGADERARQLEYELFLELRTRVVADLTALQAAAQALGVLDVCAGLAEVARTYSYCRPQLRDDTALRILDGRHPVLDQKITEERFVPNDVEMAPDGSRLHLITGPNMAGKSTYIRQVALLVLLAQVGAYIPAREAEIGLVDRIFTRVGASDDLSRGLSTFMVEMSETANILNNATARSLVILDEIGRGTSTFDGLAIAWSVAEHLHDGIAARTLFATHFHEMTKLAGALARVANFNVAVREWNDQVIFLRKIVPGAADRSYGIQVARLAGLPDQVVKRARRLLANLEKSNLHPSLVGGTSRAKKPTGEPAEQTLDLPLWATDEDSE